MAIDTQIEQLFLDGNVYNFGQHLLDGNGYNKMDDILRMAMATKSKATVLFFRGLQEQERWARKQWNNAKTAQMNQSFWEG